MCGSDEIKYNETELFSLFDKIIYSEDIELKKIRLTTLVSNGKEFTLSFSVYEKKVGLFLRMSKSDKGAIVSSIFKGCAEIKVINVLKKNIEIFFEAGRQSIIIDLMDEPIIIMAFGKDEELAKG